MLNSAHWDENCLHVTFKGIFSRHKLLDAIFDLECSFSEEAPNNWTRLVNFMDCVEEGYDAQEAILEIERTCDYTHCKATAYVIPKECMEACLDIPAIAHDANNGVRLFYCAETAKLWLNHQNIIHRRRSLH